MRKSILILSLVTTGCASEGTTTSEQEVITTVTLSFTNGGTTQNFEFNDADGDGGEAPTTDTVEITPGTYSLLVGFENRLETPAEIITEEIEDENDEHQIFLVGAKLHGPASAGPDVILTHTYDDQDAAGQPVGLKNTITSIAGETDLRVVLQHLPEIKTGTLAQEVKSAGLTSLPGESDVDVTFSISVQN